MNRFLILGLTAIISTSAMAEARRGAYDFDLHANYVFNNAFVTKNAGEPAKEEGIVMGVGSMGRYLTNKLQFGALISFQSQVWESYWGHEGAYGLGLYTAYDLTSGDSVVPF
ncbi:MAG: hypothetical protein JXN60_01680, partial [Lentisphaerae bacterium]|nr:hypothetical protein [Lentisphaerota bacterium]